MCEILADMQGDSAHHRAAAGRASSRGVPAVFRGLWIEGTEDQQGNGIRPQIRMPSCSQAGNLLVMFPDKHSVDLQLWNCNLSHKDWCRRK